MGNEVANCFCNKKATGDEIPFVKADVPVSIHEWQRDGRLIDIGLVLESVEKANIVEDGHHGPEFTVQFKSDSLDLVVCEARRGLVVIVSQAPKAHPEIQVGDAVLAVNQFKVGDFQHLVETVSEVGFPLYLTLRKARAQLERSDSARQRQKNLLAELVGAGYDRRTVLTAMMDCRNDPVSTRRLLEQHSGEDAKDEPHAVEARVADLQEALDAGHLTQEEFESTKAAVVSSY